MSERYIRVFSLPQNLYEDHAPVIIHAGAILKDTVLNTVIGQLKFQSISNKQIIALTVSVTCYDTSLQELSTVKHTYLDLTASRDDFFGDREAIKLPDARTRTMSVSVEEVVFSDHEIWRSEHTPWEQLPTWEKRDPDQDLFKERGYKSLFSSSTEHDPLAYSQKDWHDLWICGCGAINRKDESECHCCGITKESFQKVDSVQLLNEGKYVTAIEKSKSNNIKFLSEAKELFSELGDYRDSENLLSATAQKLEKTNKSNHIIKIACVSAAALFVCALVVYLIVGKLIPNKRYKRAIEYMDDKNYEAAIELFQKSGINDVEDKIKACQNALDYEKAEHLYEEKNYEEAAALYKSLGNYMNSKVQLKMCENALDYQKATKLLSDGDYIDAVAAFDQLGSYSDSAECMKNAMYSYVNEKRNNPDDTVYDYLEVLANSNYRDAKDLLESLNYKVTVVAMNTDPNDDHTILTTIPLKVEYFHYTFKLLGGHPSKPVTLTYKILLDYGDDDIYVYDGHFEWEDKLSGDTFGIGWNNGINDKYSNVMTIEVYNKETGDLLGSGSINIGEPSETQKTNDTSESVSDEKYFPISFSEYINKFNNSYSKLLMLEDSGDRFDGWLNNEYYIEVINDNQSDGYSYWPQTDHVGEAHDKFNRIIVRYYETRSNMPSLETMAIISTAGEMFAQIMDPSFRGEDFTSNISERSLNQDGEYIVWMTHNGFNYILDCYPTDGNFVFYDFIITLEDNGWFYPDGRSMLAPH